MKMKKWLALLAAAALLTVPLSGCSKEGSGDTIRIGGLAPLTGDLKQYGEAVNNAVKMWRLRRSIRMAACSARI